MAQIASESCSVSGHPVTVDIISPISSFQACPALSLVLDLLSGLVKGSAA